MSARPPGTRSWARSGTRPAASSVTTPLSGGTRAAPPRSARTSTRTPRSPASTWLAGLCDMTPDFSPIMGPTPVEGFLVDVGWGTYGFKAGPVSGEAMAQCIASGETPGIIAAFGLDRFGEGALVGEKGAAAVGH